MEEQFVAHISDSGKVQSVAEHSPKTATLIKCQSLCLLSFWIV